MAAEICGLDPELLNRLYNILCVLSSTSAKFNTKMLETYCWDTMVLILAKYPWFCIPHAVHKILVHSTQVMELKVLPVGALSEEAQEARNKDVKNFREFFSLKTSRQNTNRDVMRRLLVSSDPAISRIRKSSSEIKKDCLPEKAREFLLE